MFIVLLDEPGLFVYESPDAAARDIEPPDAEQIVRAAFDDQAVPYRVDWIRPNKRRRWFWGFGSVAFGEYRFVPAGPADQQALAQLLEQHPDANPPEAQAALNALRQRKVSGSSSVICRFGTLRQAGHSRDETLQVLRTEGAGPMECIFALREIERVGLAEAKRIVHESPAWAEVLRENDESLIAELVRQWKTSPG
jgi:ribosomal protein L7/L12